MESMEKLIQMITQKLKAPVNKRLRILCLGAHSDDIEIGCGGTILRCFEEFKHTEVYWVVFSASKERGVEAKDSAELFTQKAYTKHIILRDFRDGFFPYQWKEIKEYFEELKKNIAPDIIFTHFRNDLHQDHRLISELTYNTYRNHLILEYEILKYDGDISSPNFYVNLDSDTTQQKIDNIVSTFKSQEKRGWFTQDAFSSIMRIRGIESNSPWKYAEGFYCRKIIF